MARDRSPPPTSSGDIPAWFMTYSDVITLMMTFFILLLTFATAEPEKFDQMQTAVFGIGERTGVAGNNREAIDRDSLALRYRPTVGRLASRGSEMPPLHTDPLREAVGKGLAALDQENELAREQQVEFEIDAGMFIGGDGSLTPIAKQHLGMLARQMQRLPVTARFEVSTTDDIPAAIEAARSLTELFQIHPGRLAVSLSPSNTPSRHLRITISRRNTPFPTIDEHNAPSASGHGSEN
ncbi:MAG: flagellar motor protein MotB [Planctomycetaceae bacterium]|nr:flagellar motor protein MotB [Planctomycetaceae bacterium]